MALGVGEINVNTEPGMMQGLASGNALINQSLSNKVKSVEAKYAPWVQYANALSHLAYANYLPWQIQASALSNPLLAYAFKDNPEQFAGMVQQFAKGFPTSNAMTSASGIRLPGDTSKGLLSLLINKIFGGEQESKNPSFAAPNNAMVPAVSGEASAPSIMQSGPATTLTPSFNQNSLQALNPALGGGTSGYLGAQTAAGTKSPFMSAPTVPNPNVPGGVTVAPNVETTGKAQASVLASKRVAPIIKKLSEEWGDFYTLKGGAKLIGSSIGNIIGFNDKTLQKFGLSKELPSKYLEAKADAGKSVVDLMNLYGIHQEAGMADRIASAIEPHFGENQEAYQSRVKKELESIAQQQAINEQTLGGGFNINPLGYQAPTAQNQPAESQPTKKSQKNMKNIVDKILSYSYLSPQEFQEAFKTYDAETQQAVINEMNKRGWH